MSLWTYSESLELAVELLGKGRELANKLGVELAALVLGHNVGPRVEELAYYGADKVYFVDHPNLATPTAELYANTLAALANKYGPDAVLIGATKRGNELAARLAAMLGVGCVTNCTGVDVDRDAKLLLLSRLAYGGTAISTQRCKAKPQIATVPPRTFERAVKVGKRSEVVKVDVEVGEPRVKVLELKKKEFKGARLEEADVVVVAGRGVKKKEDVAMLEELAKLLGGVVGYTRPLAFDLKWATQWVGMSGVTIKPRLYVGVGVSGAIQHVAGIRDSKVIVAINTDADAPIFKAADYGVVGDLYAVVPELVKKIKERAK
ncbi:MAG: electron transfer flavoprotein subunit alpha/FixB family protein [Candidatus Nezhaarchaeota archaeon]|nr:electron transfer flavoprotein subunit alpha/FixB family protein [Candidatus Nezhaarchaeota archaeon]